MVAERIRSTRVMFPCIRLLFALARHSLNALNLISGDTSSSTGSNQGLTGSQQAARTWMRTMEQQFHWPKTLVCEISLGYGLWLDPFDPLFASTDSPRLCCVPDSRPGGILCMPRARGKTVVAAHFIADLWPRKHALPASAGSCVRIRGKPHLNCTLLLCRAALCTQWEQTPETKPALRASVGDFFSRETGHDAETLLRRMSCCSRCCFLHNVR